MKSLNIPLENKVDIIKLDLGNSKVLISGDKIELVDLGIDIYVENNNMCISNKKTKEYVYESCKYEEKHISNNESTVKDYEESYMKESSDQLELEVKNKEVTEVTKEDSKERNQLKINKSRDLMRDKIVEEIQSSLGKCFDVRKASIRDHNANILIFRMKNDGSDDEKTDPMKVKILYSKDYSPMNTEVTSGYFTLDYTRYNDSDFYIFAIEGCINEPHYILVSKSTMNSIVTKKRGKNNIYRFNIKISDINGIQDRYDTADLLEGEENIDLRRYYRNVVPVYDYVEQVYIKRNIMDANGFENFEFRDNIIRFQKKVNGISIERNNSIAIVSNYRFKFYSSEKNYNVNIEDKDLENYDVFVFRFLDSNKGISYYSFNKKSLNKYIDKEGQYIYITNEKIKSDLNRESQWNVEDILNY